MGVIVSTDLVSVADAEITARSTATGYAKSNVMDFWHLKRRWRCDDLTKSDSNPALVFDLGAATTVDAVFLNDINFNKVAILGHASDLDDDWSGATFDSGDITVSQNTFTGRYQAYIPLTSFNLRWLAVMTVADASAVGSYTSKWEIGTVCIIDSKTELTSNMAYGYQRGATKPYTDISLPHGGTERINLSDVYQWQATATFGTRTITNEANLQTMNLMDMSDPFVWYENNSDTSDCYLCLRDNAYIGTVVANDLVTGNQIRLRELI